MSVTPADDPYAAIAALYDLEHAAWTDDLELYLNVARVVGDPILELGCGTGRLLVPLAEAGFRVTGVDRSAAMLARAERFAADAGVADRVELVETGMTELGGLPAGTFGLVLVPLNGLLHLASAGEQRHALTAARRLLDPRGQLVLDLMNPTPETLRSIDGGVIHEGQWTLVDGTRADKFGARRVFPAEQRIDTDLWYDLIGSDGAVRRIATSFPMRYVHRAELELMLELAGFAEWQVYGGYELEPFDDAADRLVVTAEATPSR
ncbi:MAG TPA: class I SAM-dependent methyltransferase [Thermomicrobiales bacterium]|nr:class I SAM-dependent methyltransferase [Thermomicrobiales bacterium]